MKRVRLNLAALLLLCLAVSVAARAEWPWESDGLMGLWSWLGLGCFEEAVREAEQAVRRNPVDTEARLVLAMLLEERGDGSRAEHEYRLALPGPEDRPYLLTVLGRLALRRGEWKTAADRFRGALKDEPGMAHAAYGLAEALEAAGDRRGARAVLRRLVKQAPSWPDAHLFLGDLLADGGEKVETLIALYRQAVQANPSHLELRLRYARSLAQAGRTNEAKREYACVLYLDPANAEARASLSGG